MKTVYKKYSPLNKAFTMLELVFVIVIIGILSIAIIPSFNANKTREAADQVISHIRYTQHLAMMDNKFNPIEPNWFQQRWHIGFTQDGTNDIYYVASDANNNGALVSSEYAANVLDEGKILSGESTLGDRTPELDLTGKYGVSVVNNCSTNGRIFFDNMGRPYKDTTFPATAPYQNLIKNPCSIILSDGDVANNVTITLQPETGYVNITQ